MVRPDAGEVLRYEAGDPAGSRPGDQRPLSIHPQSLVRGGLITMSGLGIALGNGISLALLVVTALLVYVPRIRAEEKMLQQAFGAAFDEYKRRSWALVPFVW